MRKENQRDQRKRISEEMVCVIQSKKYQLSTPQLFACSYARYFSQPLSNIAHPQTDCHSHELPPT